MTPDECPHCRSKLEIVCVKFRVRGARIVSVCPNCAILAADDWCDLYREDLLISGLPAALKGAVSAVEALGSRVRYGAGSLIAAVVAAAALRHVSHVSGRVAPEEIRAVTLVTLLLAIPLLALVWMRRLR